MPVLTRQMCCLFAIFSRLYFWCVQYRQVERLERYRFFLEIGLLADMDFL